MSPARSILGNDPSGIDESDDLEAIRRDREAHLLWQEIWHNGFQDEADFDQDFQNVALAAQDWEAATYFERIRALRILCRRFGRNNTSLLAAMASPRAGHPWLIRVRPRKDSEKPDGGKRHRKRKREDLAQRIGMEVYQRMAAGQSKVDAINSVKEDYRTGAPYPTNGIFPPVNRPKIALPDIDGIEKLLAIFRQKARKRGYADVYASLGPVVQEPKLKLKDIPKRGRPRKK